jgi:hypothetical protein
MKPIIAILVLLLTCGCIHTRSKPLSQARLLVELPEFCNTPDAMTLTAQGDVILSVPNFNDDKVDALLMKITPDNKAERFFDFPDDPVVGKIRPLGICAAPNGDLYIADCQIFADNDHKSRVLRLVMKDGKPTTLVTVVEGFICSNAVIIRDGYLYVSETILVNDAKPMISGVFRFKMGEEGIKLNKNGLEDPHLIATITTYNPDVPFGADGLTFDSKGNLYIGNFADGTVHKLVFGADGKVVSNTIFAKAPFMKCADGIFCDLRTDKMYVSDSLANAVQIVSPDGSVQTLVQDGNNTGAGGRLDQPCEVLIRGDELIISNMDFPVPTGVNTTWDKPYTLSIVDLPKD